LLVVIPLLVLLTNSLDVCFAVRVEEFFAALLPCCPEFGPSDGVRVAFIVENGAPIELLEFTDPNHPGRRPQSKMLM
jgi:hypothetical protein